ncbi:MAG: multidrug effflux MFS transporter [Gammaproteobacteria bacterium]|nr:multidrug effflux MFS transporter [Gammaproteobacteria bacterium]
MKLSLAAPRKFVFVLGCLTTLAAMTIDMSLPAIPDMVRSMATRISAGQMIVGAFMLGAALGQLPAGLLSDRFGRRPVLICGLVVFTIMSAVCTFAQSIEIMLTARFVQGLSSAVGTVVTRAIVRDITSGAAAARLMSVLVMIFTAAPMLAPVLGGYLVTLWGWRAPFAAISALGFVLLVSTIAVIHETHKADASERILRQFTSSVRQFFAQRQSILGALLVMLPSAGFLSMITGSPALVIEIYGYPAQQFGLLFALIGVAILAGSTLNRSLLHRYSGIQVIGLAASTLGLAGVQLLLIAWLEDVPLFWIWGNFCLYMFGVGMVLPNAAALALDPLPQTAGVSSSIVGVLQTLSAALGSLASGFIFDGSVGRIVIILGIFGSATFAAYALRHLVLRGTAIIQAPS